MVSNPGDGSAESANNMLAHDTMRPLDDWTLLKGQKVDIYENGELIDQGRAEAVTNDGCILWLEQEGAHLRRLVEKQRGIELRIVAAHGLR